MKEKTEFVGLRMPISLRAKVKQYAEKEDTSESAIIKKATRLFLSRKSLTKSNHLR